MDWANVLREGLLAYLFFIPLLTMHEWAHAWTAWKCGDDTAQKLGRVSINPIVHMDLLGTVILPLLGLISTALGAGVIIGWGKPVPVNPLNLKHPRLQDSLIAMAGPAMNIVLAIALLLLVKVQKTGPIADAASQMAFLSLFLCFFNLLPIPPLDGSHLIMNLVRMSYKTYIRLSVAGFIVVIVLMQFRWMQLFLTGVVATSFNFIRKMLALP
jgi:Zn-dependent protease